MQTKKIDSKETYVRDHSEVLEGALAAPVDHGMCSGLGGGGGGDETNAAFPRLDG